MPTIDIPDKICPHCGGTKWYVFYQYYKDNKYTLYRCSKIVLEKSKEWRGANKEKTKLIYKRSRDKVKHTEDYIKKNQERASNYYKKYPERVKVNAKLWRLKNPEKTKNIVQKVRKDGIKNLGNSYIKGLICQDTPLSFKDIPKDFIELKRKQLLLKRQLNHL